MPSSTENNHKFLVCLKSWNYYSQRRTESRLYNIDDVEIPNHYGKRTKPISITLQALLIRKTSTQTFGIFIDKWLKVLISPAIQTLLLFSKFETK